MIIKPSLIGKWLVPFAVSMMSSQAFAQAENFKDVAQTGSENIFALMGILFAASAVIGFFLCILGIMYFKKDKQQPNQGHGGTGMTYLGVGIALLAVTFIINIVLNSFGGTGDDARNRLEDTGWKQGG